MRRVSWTGVLAVALVLAAPVPAGAATASMGQKCVRYYNSSGDVIASRCAKGTVVYASYNANKWTITYYRMYYRVSGGLDWGPHHNETLAGPTYGYAGAGIGPKGYNSPDKGGANVWINRGGYGYSRTWKGQTVFSLRAWFDIPHVSDPSRDLASHYF